MPDISERSLEAALEAGLLAGGLDDPPPPVEAREKPGPFGFSDGLPGGYYKRSAEDYDRDLCLIRRDVLDFVLATQAKTWERLAQHHGAEVEERFLRRLSKEVEARGVLDVLRRGIKDSGCSFDLAFYKPSSGLNPELQSRYRGNLFSVVRQVRYSRKNENSLDVVLFLNGLPIFTAELKNPFTGQRVKDAIRQYQFPDSALRRQRQVQLDRMAGASVVRAAWPRRPPRF